MSNGEKKVTMEQDPPKGIEASSAAATIDLLRDLSERFDYFVIDEQATVNIPGFGEVRARRVRGVVLVVRPRGAHRRYYQVLQGGPVAGRINFRQLNPGHPYELKAIHERDLSIALAQLAADSEHAETRGVIHLEPSRELEGETPHEEAKRPAEVDPGWVELFANATWGAVWSGPGWPTWTEKWWLPNNLDSLDGFDGQVHDKPETYQQPGGLTEWEHSVSALTGSYENDNISTGWSRVEKSGSNVAVIHRVTVTSGSKYVDTWWLSSSFVWWGNNNQAAKVIATDQSTAQNVRGGFATNTRYRHNISKKT